jgi:hypothetical protein
MRALHKSKVMVAAPLLALLGIAAATGCRERAEPPPRPREKVPPRRVIDPPGTVRPLPPYAISNSAVGPYQLGAPLSNVLYELPSGPRMALLDVPGLIKQNVIRAEDDGVLVSGAVLGDAMVIAVVSKEVARTDSGIAVGSLLADVTRELGVASEPTVARDPRLLMPQRMPSARLVMQGDRVEAFLLKAGPTTGIPTTAPGSTELVPVGGAASSTSGAAGVAGTSGAPVPSSAGTSDVGGKHAGKPDPRGKPAGKGDPKLARDAKAATSMRCPPPKASETEIGPWFPACMSPAGELVRVRDEEVSVRSADGKERVIAQLRVRGLVFAAPLRGGERAEDRDELVVITKTMRPDEDERTWTVALYHLEAGRLVRVVEQVVYRLSTEGARWIGVSLDEVELYLELTSREDAVAVGGFLLTKVGGQIRDAVSLRESDVSRRRGGGTGAESGGAGGGLTILSGSGIESANGTTAPVDAGVDAATPAPDGAL